MDQNEKKNNVIVMPSATHIPAAFAVSLHIRNLMATYGPNTVRHIIQELFFEDALREESADLFQKVSEGQE